MFDRSHININAYVYLLDDVSIAGANRPARNTARSSIATVLLCLSIYLRNIITLLRKASPCHDFITYERGSLHVSQHWWLQVIGFNDVLVYEIFREFWQKSFEVYSNLFSWKILRSSPSWYTENLDSPLPFIGKNYFITTHFIRAGFLIDGIDCCISYLMTSDHVTPKIYAWCMKI